MKKLLELEERLKKAKEELEKGTWLGGTQTSGQSGGATQGTAGSGSGPSIAEQIGFGKNEMMGYGEDDVNTVTKDEDKKEEKEDEKKDKKIVAEAMDEHNEKKHGEAKDKDSAYKDMKVEKGCDSEMIKYDKNGQWSIKKGDNFGLTASTKSLEPKPTGKQPPKGSEHGQVKVIKEKK